MLRAPWRVVVLLILLSFVTLWLGHRLGGRVGLFVASSLVIIFHMLSFFLGELKLSQIFEARPLLGQDEWQVGPTLAQLCEKARLPLPQVHKFNEYAPLLMTTGRDWNSSHIIFSSAFFDRLTPSEREVCLALGIARIKRHQLLPSTYASALSGALIQWVKPIHHVSSAQRPSFWNWMTRMTQTFFIRLIYSPNEVFQDDALAAELVGDSGRVAQLLWKIEGQLRSRPLNIPPSLGHLFVVSPLTTQKKFRYFLSQPSVQSRITKLTGSYPI